MPTVPSEMPAVEGNRLLQPREETEKRGTWDGEAVSEVEVDAEEPEEGEKDESEGDDVLFVFHFAEFFVSTREMIKKKKVKNSSTQKDLSMLNCEGAGQK